MGDKVRAGRGMDVRDVVRKSALGRGSRDGRGERADDTERMGRDAQRRAMAHARARGQL